MRKNVSLSSLTVDDETGEVWLEGTVLPANGSADPSDYGPQVQVAFRMDGLLNINDRANPVVMYPLPEEPEEPEPTPDPEPAPEEPTA